MISPDASTIGNAHHAFKVRGDSRRVHHGGRPHGLHHGLAGLRSGLVLVANHRRGKGQERAAVRHAAACCRLGIGQRQEIDLRPLHLAARPEQIGVGAGSIKALPEGGNTASNELHRHTI